MSHTRINEHGMQMKVEHHHLPTHFGHANTIVNDRKWLYFGHANTIVNDRKCFVNLVRDQSNN